MERHLHVLLVDDVEDDLVLAAHALRSMSLVWQLHRARSAADALLLLDRVPIDVVVADLWMPGVSGVSLLDFARLVHPRVRRIALTASRPPSPIAADVCLDKPCAAEQIRAAIARLCYGTSTAEATRSPPPTPAHGRREARALRDRAAPSASTLPTRSIASAPRRSPSRAPALDPSCGSRAVSCPPTPPTPSTTPKPRPARSADRNASRFVPALPEARARQSRLGLYRCRLVVSRHRGSIVADERHGGGMRFAIEAARFP